MNKLEVNMYVRTKQRMFQPPQIAKIKNMVKDSGYKNQYYIELDHNLIPDYKFHIYQEDIIKASYNILDLIEVGDYVNGEKVEEIWEKVLLVGQECRPISLNNVKSVLTKEQFESMEYEVENE